MSALQHGPPSDRSGANDAMAALTEDDTEISSDPAVGWLSEKAKQFSDDADELRETTDRAAKGLGALAVAGLTAVGIEKVGDIHPRPDYWPWVAILWGGFFLMVIAIAVFVYRFWQANRPLALSASITEMQPEKRKWKLFPDKTKRKWVTDLSTDECQEIEKIYVHAISHAPFAARGERLEDYERRADRLEQDALSTPDSPASKHRLGQVERMRAEIERAQQRAKLVVVRRRMNHVFNRLIAICLAVLFVLGLGMFATAADYFDSVESQKTSESSR